MLWWIERFAPLCGAAAALVSAWACLPELQVALSTRGESLENALSPIFDLATFSAGSLFAIYVLALSRAEGFLGKIFETKTFQIFHGYVSKSIFLNISLSIWTAVFMIFGIGDLSNFGPHFVASFWTGLTVWALMSVGRVVLIFLMMVGGKVNRPRGKHVRQTS